MEDLLKINNKIKIIDKYICDIIDKFDASERGMLSQSILSHLRNLIEHIMLKFYASNGDIENTYENICNAIAFVKTRGDLKILSRFHRFLQIVASHYTFDEENSERLMLKYYEYLLKIQELVKTKESLDILENLDKFPINTDTNLREYYEKITAKITHSSISSISPQHTHTDTFYIQKIKPFFVANKIYYEITFSLAYDNISKFDRIIAFTNLDISGYYAVRLSFINENIKILDKTMPIFIIVKWEVSIRPCELNNFSDILGAGLNINRNHTEYRNLMLYLTKNGFTLPEIIDFPDSHFQFIRQQITPNTKAKHFFDVLEECRNIIKNKQSGGNILKYLLYNLNNKIIKNQHAASNSKLSTLYLSNRCIPFDQMPFTTSLINHNPRFTDLFACIDFTNRKHEILARFIRNNSEINGQLYTSVKDVIEFADIDTLIQSYNRALWFGHAGRRLEKYNRHIYMQEYEDDTLYIIRRLIEMTNIGVLNYSNSVTSWLQSTAHAIDCEEKCISLTQLFEKSSVALIYGSAGTGKTTMIHHISHFFSDKNKLFLANTNPAVDNLKRRVSTANCTFSTITSFLMRRNRITNYDILIIDECSTVSNRDMRAILEKSTFSLLVLVGDVYQIESIRFGNWFSVTREFIPKTSVFELTTPYRSKNDALLELWNRVRKMDETLLEHMTKMNYSVSLDSTIFENFEKDEIILCLNYDGLYGINNINRFLQEANPKQPISWGIYLFKVNDPILFNESERFAPLIYNNMKGKIVKIVISDNQIQFDIELDKIINGLDARGYDFILLDNSLDGNSVIRFLVDKSENSDEDDDPYSKSKIPFQIAYAVSIHKAQGLEYNSVKIVITDEINELITHNIFYTAITRTRDKLKIYWTPEVGKKVLSSITPRTNGKDLALLKSRI